MRTCTICAHPERTAIDAALIAQRPYRDISRQYHVSKDALARHRLHLIDDLRRHDEANVESAAIVRQLELLRLDGLQYAVWPAAVAGKARAITIILRIMERRARLLGLDAPTAVRHSRGPARPIRVRGRITVTENPCDSLATIDALEVAGVVPRGTQQALHAALVALDTPERDDERRTHP